MELRMLHSEFHPALRTPIPTPHSGFRTPNFASASGPSHSEFRIPNSELLQAFRI